MTTTLDTATLADRLRDLALHELCEAWSADQVEMTDSSAERYGAAHDAVSTVIDEAIDALAAAKEAHDLTKDALAEARREIARLRKAYEQKRADLARETAAVEVLARVLLDDNHSPDGFHAYGDRCRHCAALKEALRRGPLAVPVPAGDTSHDEPEVQS